MKFIKSFQLPDKPLGGRYKIIQPLGVGGFGQTFLAYDIHLPDHPRCVIKQLKPQVTDPKNLKTAGRLFDTEARVLYRLGEHDQIPRLLAHFEENQEFYLAQEFIEGVLLNTLFERDLPWPEERVVALLHDILHVLAFVHQQDVIHRDIKPSNLIQRHDGKIVLIDFGAVKQVNTQFMYANQSGQSHLTIAIGTPGYMPNEQVSGNPRFSSDVYAVGMIGIQALTGIPPKRLALNPRTSEIEWRDAVSHVSPVLADILDRMVRYDFRTRYPTAVEALAAIQSLGAGPLAPSPSETASFNPPAPDPTQVSATAPAPTSFFPASAPPPVTATPPPSLSPPTSPPMTAATVPAPIQPKTVAPQPTRTTIALGRLTQQQVVRRFSPVVLLLGLLAGLALWVRTCAAPPGEPVAGSSPSPSTAASPQPAASSPAGPSAAELLSQAEQLRQSKQYAVALERYDQAIARDPKVSDAFWGRCYSLNKLNRLQEAIPACDRALQLDPNNYKALSSKGFILNYQQRYQEALTLSERAIQIEPKYVEAWGNRGASLLLLNRPEEALAALDQAIQIKPDEPEVWNNRGAALWSLRRFDEAIASIEKAIALKPDYQEAQNLRRQIREKLGR